jgi:hypothetical protein
MSTYNLTELTEGTGLGRIVSGLNTLSGGVLGWLLLLMVWVFVFLTIQDTNRVKVATSSFITSISAGVFYLVGIVEPYVLWITGFVFAVSIVVLYVNPKD